MTTNHEFVCYRTGRTIPEKTQAGLRHSCATGVKRPARFRCQWRSTRAERFSSNRQDFIMATHICPENPHPEEVTEVQEIVQSIVLIGKPCWKFW